MSYFYSKELQVIIDNINAIVFLNSNYKVFERALNKSFFRPSKPEDGLMLEILQKLIIEKAYTMRMQEFEIEANLIDPSSFMGWIKIALGYSQELRKEYIYKYRNNEYLIETHKMFTNSLDILCHEYTIDNYTTCITYFDELWKELLKN